MSEEQGKWILEIFGEDDTLVWEQDLDEMTVAILEYNYKADFSMYGSNPITEDIFVSYVVPPYAPVSGEG